MCVGRGGEGEKHNVRPLSERGEVAGEIAASPVHQQDDVQPRSTTRMLTQNRLERSK